MCRCTGCVPTSQLPGDAIPSARCSECVEQHGGIAALCSARVHATSPKYTPLCVHRTHINTSRLMEPLGTCVRAYACQTQPLCAKGVCIPSQVQHE